MHKLFRSLFLAVLSIGFICSLFAGSIPAEALVKGWTPSEDGSLSSEANGDNPLGIVIQPSDKEEAEDTKIGNYPDLGSDQVFPFEPGLGNGA